MADLNLSTLRAVFRKRYTRLPENLSDKTNAWCTSRKPGRRATTSAFLAIAVLLSAVPYVTQLGFYSDDWGFLSVLSAAPHRSLTDYFRAISAEPQIGDKPGQSILLSLLYGLSGLCPIGYHLFNTVLFAIAITLLYVVLREIELPDATAFAIALVYAFLPG